MGYLMIYHIKDNPGAPSILQDIHINRKPIYYSSLSQVYINKVFLHGFNIQFLSNTITIQTQGRQYSVSPEILLMAICWFGHITGHGVGVNNSTYLHHSALVTATLSDFI